MIVLELHYRTLANKDWATLIFVITLALIVFGKIGF